MPHKVAAPVLHSRLVSLLRKPLSPELAASFRGIEIADHGGNGSSQHRVLGRSDASFVVHSQIEERVIVADVVDENECSCRGGVGVPRHAAVSYTHLRAHE